MREDYALKSYAESMGFKVEPERTGALCFTKGVHRIWSIREGWQTAKLIDGRYTDHKPFDSLKVALNYVQNNNYKEG